MANIKVAVRVRPISERELNHTGSEIVIHTNEKEVSLVNLKVSTYKAGDSRKRTKTYEFDYCFDSSNPKSSNYANQSSIYDALGQSVLNAIFSDYNACLVAYGQSASGKTYTMMGTKEDPGLIPRLCKDLFTKLSSQEETDSENLKHQAFVSYLEIYNEKVRDLLRPSTNVSGLRVREHPRLGPYVQGLTHHLVSNLGSLMSYIDEGTKARKTASTLQNPNSSRSHALLTVSLSPISKNDHSTPSSSATTKRKEDFHSGSRLHLVDLAGSESAVTCSGIHRLKEGANINKSLVALGNVISALAERGSAGSAPGRRYIPYRDSSLTWLLKDALGGNATTIMLATISPASGSYNETAHTLRFAQRAQSVVNKPVVNEDPVARTIRELRAEVARLKSLLSERNLETDNKITCSCKYDQDQECSKENEQDKKIEKKKATEDTTTSTINIAQVTKITSKESIVTSIRKCSSNESLFRRDIDSNAKAVTRFKSFESLYATKGREIQNRYDPRVVSELNNVEVNLFPSSPVDVSTLVAVLIQSEDVNDNNSDRDSTKIEAICHDNALNGNNSLIFSDAGSHLTQLDNAESKNHKLEENHIVPEKKNKVEGRGRLKKQDSVDGSYSVKKSIGINAPLLKRFSSVEGLAKKKDLPGTIERSHTNLEKHSITDKGKKLNNIEEADDWKSTNNKLPTSLWRGSVSDGKEIRRKHSIDESDKGTNKDASVVLKNKNSLRKTSIDGTKRKTSKDSSSSSSKEDQISVFNVIKDQRKGSLDQELSNKTHTPIQRVRRADIVAAVTERLYSHGKKNTEENVTATTTPTTSTPNHEFRSPENTDVKLATTTRMRLQEISRKMLAKRRKICADTQTDITQTVRVKDTASLTDETPKIHRKDASVLTDEHEDLSEFIAQRTTSSVRRVKEISTLTERQLTPIIRSKDVMCITEEYDEQSEICTYLNDSGILSDATQTYSNSNLSLAETLGVYDGTHVEASTSTTDRVPNITNSSIQTQGEIKAIVDSPCIQHCHSHCCDKTHKSPCQEEDLNNSSDKNVISISLPEDMICITIESSDSLESRIAVVEDSNYSEQKICVRDCEIQTDLQNALDRVTLEDNNNSVSYKTVSVSTNNCSDFNVSESKTFRIENIFQDSKSSDSTHPQLTITVDPKQRVFSKNSIIFTNTVGTSSLPGIHDYKSGVENKFCNSKSNAGQSTKWSFPDYCLGTTDFLLKRRNERLNSRLQLSNNILNQNKNHYSPKIPLLLNVFLQEILLNSVKTTNDNEKQSQRIMLSSKSSWPNNPIVENQENYASANINPNKSKFSRVSNEIKSPDKTKIFSKSIDPYFSDDSLDLCEDCDKDTINIENMKLNYEIENYPCPPDVVAHTKKDENKQKIFPGTLENVNNKDFDDNICDEVPKFKPNSLTDILQDYNLLYFGDSCSSEISETVESSNFITKDTQNIMRKRVSFTDDISCKAESSNLTFEMKTNVIPKSIIKKNTLNSSIPQTLCSETSQKYHVSSKPLINTDSSKISFVSSSSDELAQKKSIDFTNIQRLNANEEATTSKDFKEMQFSTHESLDSCHDSSDSYISDEKDDDIFQNYFDEALTFMQNLDSKTKNKTQQQRSCNQRHKNWNDYIARLTIADNVEELLEEDIFSIPKKSFERCVNGISRLENCIEKIKSQNDVLREKYGIDVDCTSSLETYNRVSKDNYQFSRPKIHSQTKDCSIPQNNWTKMYHENDNEKCSPSSYSFNFTEESVFDDTTSDEDLYWKPTKARLRLKRDSKISKSAMQSPSSYSRLRQAYACNISRSENHGNLNNLHSLTLSNSATESDKISSINNHQLESTSTKSLTNFNVPNFVKRSPIQNTYLPKMRTFLSNQKATVSSFSSDTKSLENISNKSRRKSRYSGKYPRARLLQLLSERRKIVQSSRDSGAI